LLSVVWCVQGGMILCGVMARVDITTAKIRSCIAVGSGLFLEGELLLETDATFLHPARLSALG
jgi:hypothetical protein